MAQPDLLVAPFKPVDWADIFDNRPNPVNHADPVSPLFPPSPLSSSSDITMDNNLANFFLQTKESPTVFNEFDEAIPTPLATATDINSLPNQPFRRRRPGCPSKAQLSVECSSNHLYGRAARREIHNDSATRSRARVNTALDALWKEVPEKRKCIQTRGKDTVRQLSRAEKVEITLLYIRDLKAKMVRRGQI